MDGWNSLKLYPFIAISNFGNKKSQQVLNIGSTVDPLFMATLLHFETFDMTKKKN
jgi:hypothetical protein